MQVEERLKIVEAQLAALRATIEQRDKEAIRAATDPKKETARGSNEAPGREHGARQGGPFALAKDVR